MRHCAWAAVTAATVVATRAGLGIEVCVGGGGGHGGQGNRRTWILGVQRKRARERGGGWARGGDQCAKRLRGVCLTLPRPRWPWGSGVRQWCGGNTLSGVTRPHGMSRRWVVTSHVTPP